MKTSTVLSVVIYLLDEVLIKFNSQSILQIFGCKLRDLNFVIVTLTGKSKMKKSPIRMYKTGHNISMLMFHISGIEPSTVQCSTWVFGRHCWRRL